MQILMGFNKAWLHVAVGRGWWWGQQPRAEPCDGGAGAVAGNQEWSERGKWRKRCNGKHRVVLAEPLLGQEF